MEKKCISPRKDGKMKMKGLAMMAVVGMLLAGTPLVTAYEPFITDSNNNEFKPVARFKGVWGFMEDNETRGHVWGIIERGEHYGFVKGAWNKGNLTAEVAINTPVNRITGVFRNGYFNGRLIFADGRVCPIVGLYKVNTTENTFRARWMTENRVGWTYGEFFPLQKNQVIYERISLQEEAISISKGQ